MKDRDCPVGWQRITLTGMSLASFELLLNNESEKCDGGIWSELFRGTVETLATLKHLELSLMLKFNGRSNRMSGTSL
jgi:hypothetical protein